MKPTRVVAAILALSFLSVALLSAALPAQDLKMSVSSAGGSTGLVCAPTDCTPAPLAAQRGQSLQFLTMGATRQPHLLLLSLPPAQCTPLPGISGSLIVQGQLIGMPLPMQFMRVYVSGPGPNCGGWMGFGSLMIPTTMPPRVDVLMQMASIVWTPNGMQVGLSNAAAVTIV